MTSCTRCDPPSGAPPERGDLQLFIPLAHTAGKLHGALKSAGHDVTRKDDLLIVPLRISDLASLGARIDESTSPQEREMIRALFVPEGKTLSPADYFSVDTLDRTLGKLRAHWLNEAVAGGNITSLFQPIVYAGQPGKVFAYEALMRVREGDVLNGPAEALAVARQADALSMLDQAARRSAILQAKRYDIQERLFINFAPTSIYDPVFCLRTTLETLRECAIPHNRVVFEVIESERITDFGHLAKIMRFYREQGMEVALDDLGSGYGSLQLLDRLHPDYVKIDMHFVHGVDTDAYKSTICEKLIDTAKGLGVAVIAEGIERAEEAEWLRAHGVDYLQGFYFAKPAEPPPLQK